MKIIKARKLDAIAQSVKADAAPLFAVTRIDSDGKALQHAIFISAKDTKAIEGILTHIFNANTKKMVLEDFEELGGI